MITAVTPWMIHGVEIDPMLLRTTCEVVSAFAHSATLERQAALQTSDVDTARHLEIYCWFHFFDAPVRSYKFAV
jgi:hypothetical protein